jgi:hypothetical protein
MNPLQIVGWGGLRVFLGLLVFKGAIQELKLYGMPGVAEVQCDDSLSVCLQNLFAQESC